MYALFASDVRHYMELNIFDIYWYRDKIPLIRGRKQLIDVKVNWKY